MVRSAAHPLKKDCARATTGNFILTPHTLRPARSKVIRAPRDQRVVYLWISGVLCASALSAQAYGLLGLLHSDAPTDEHGRELQRCHAFLTGAEAPQPRRKTILCTAYPPLKT